MIKIIPQKNNLAAEILCNLKKINSEDIQKIKSLLLKYGMIYFRNQKLSSSEYLTFSKNFGKPISYPRLKELSEKFSEITAVQRKKMTKDQVLVSSFMQTQVIQKSLQDLQCYFQK